MEAQDLGVPATVIEAAVAARSLSARKAERVAGEALFGAPERNLDGTLGDKDQTLRVLEEALLAGKIAAYAQGFDVMAKASETWNWNLPLGTIARIWRAGCIIRSTFLDDIASAYASMGTISNLMMVEPFTGMLRTSNRSLRGVVAAAALKGIARAGAVLGARLFRLCRGRPAPPPISPRRSATSSAPTASSGSASRAWWRTGPGRHRPDRSRKCGRGRPQDAAARP